MNIVNINDNLINLDAVAVVENRGKGIRIRYIGGYQTVIDCLDYDTFVKWAKENLVSDYADGYKKGIEDATQDMRTTISETTDEVISRVADIVRKYFDYNGGNHREVFREIISKVYKVRKEVIKIMNDAQAELDTDPAECEGACWAVLEETKQKVFKLTEANND